MYIKDVEQRTGLSRANIRYYEQEGLVHPARRKNGYRDYSPDDLETLLRVRLLRRLDVPIEEIRAMQAGKLSLSEALSQRLAALRRREEQARADQSVCRAMQADHACYNTLDAEKHWQLLYTPPQTAPAAARTDRQEPCPWRRFLARGLDMLLCSSAVALALMLGRIAPQTPGFSLLTYVGSLLLMLGVEPVLLHLWGVTPGKLLLGLTVEQPDGRRPTWGQAYAYTAMAVVYGIALYIPVLRLWRLRRSYLDCRDGLEMPWEGELLCQSRDIPWWRWALLPAAWGLVILAIIGASNILLTPAAQPGGADGGGVCREFQPGGPGHGLPSADALQRHMGTGFTPGICSHPGKRLSQPPGVRNRRQRISDRREVPVLLYRPGRRGPVLRPGLRLCQHCLYPAAAIGHAGQPGRLCPGYGGAGQRPLGPGLCV